MSNEILINASPVEIRVAVIENGLLQEVLREDLLVAAAPGQAEENRRRHAGHEGPPGDLGKP